MEKSFKVRISFSTEEIEMLSRDPDLGEGGGDMDTLLYALLRIGVNDHIERIKRQAEREAAPAPFHH